MSIIHLSTAINAPVEKCFDLARIIDLHVKSMTRSDEKAIAGRTKGLIEFGETVTWQAKHLGVQQNLTSKITRFNYPHSFTDEMVSGAFKSFKHQHLFSQKDGHTIMEDVFIFESPLGIIGKLINYLFLTSYMTKLLKERNTVIKEAAESNP